MNSLLYVGGIQNVSREITLGYVVVGILVAVALLCGCDESEQIPRNDPVPYELLPTNMLWGVDMFFFDSLQTKIHVVAGHFRWFPSEQQTYLDSGVVTEFYSASGRIAARLWCDSARVESVTGNMWAFGNVRVVSDSTGVKLWTLSLRWDNRIRKLMTNDYVRIERPGEVIEGGYGFESDEYLHHYTIFKVQGKVIP